MHVASTHDEAQLSLDELVLEISQLGCVGSGSAEPREEGRLSARLAHAADIFDRPIY
jgi:hypothetical protein